MRSLSTPPGVTAESFSHQVESGSQPAITLARSPSTGIAGGGLQVAGDREVDAVVVLGDRAPVGHDPRAVASGTSRGVGWP